MSTSGPFGTWTSPITAQVVATQGLRLGAPVVDGSDVYWLEGRPAEGGRNVLVRRAADGTLRELTPPGFNVRTRVHEYGGGAYVVHRGLVVFANFADQRLYRLDAGPAAGGALTPVPMTPEGRWHFADAVVDAARNRLVCVREDHTVEGRECVNTLVAVPLDGSGGAGQVLAEGYDFYATPRLSPDGAKLAWICWRHPQMPWDGTELWVADVDAEGALANARRVAGSETESIYQPGWSPGGELWFVSDRDDRWRLYRVVPGVRGAGSGSVRGAGSLDPANGATMLPVEPAPPADAETGRPLWILGTTCWTFSSAARVVVSFTREGRWHLGCANLGTGAFRELVPGLEPGPWLAAADGEVVLVAGSATAPDAVMAVHAESGATRVLRAVGGTSIDAGYLSVPQSLWFPTNGDRTAQLFYYPPRNHDFVPIGGESAAAHRHQPRRSGGGRRLDPGLRGAVLDQPRLRGRRRELRRQHRLRTRVPPAAQRAMGCGGRGGFDQGRRVPGARGQGRPLAARHPGWQRRRVHHAGGAHPLPGRVQGRRELLRRQRSRSHPARLAQVRGAVPRYPRRSLPGDESALRGAVAGARVDRLSCPLILFQGLEDKVVPPNQSEMVADALRRKGRPVAYLAFEGEQHGFRKAENIIRSLEAELYFYGAVFGFAPADRIEPVAIENLPPQLAVGLQTDRQEAGLARPRVQPPGTGMRGTALAWDGGSGGYGGERRWRCARRATGRGGPTPGFDAVS